MINYNKTPVLNSERLVLKEITPKNYMSIIEISVYDGFFAKDLDDVKIIYDKITVDCKLGESIHWGIFLKSSGKITGNCGFYRGFKNNIGEIGYVLNKEFRGQGIMSEAVNLICNFGFCNLNLSKITAYTDLDNFNSQKVLKRNGFDVIESDNNVLKFAKLPITIR